MNVLLGFCEDCHVVQVFYFTSVRQNKILQIVFKNIEQFKIKLFYLFFKKNGLLNTFIYTINE